MPMGCKQLPMGLMAYGSNLGQTKPCSILGRCVRILSCLPLSCATFPVMLFPQVHDCEGQLQWAKFHDQFGSLTATGDN
jgi:hypothetical protein